MIFRGSQTDSPRSHLGYTGCQGLFDEEIICETTDVDHSSFFKEVSCKCVSVSIILVLIFPL